MRVCIFVGTRPEIIKISPVVDELDVSGASPFIVYTDQHSSDEMAGAFFRQLGLQAPAYSLGWKAQESGDALKKAIGILAREGPDFVIVQGDTRSALLGALAAKLCRLRLAHVEAGLRCYDPESPEERNRITIDSIADLLFAPTEEARNNLRAEGIVEGVYVVGNTVCDSLLKNREKARRLMGRLSKAHGICWDYGVLTLHRSENVDSRKRLASLLSKTKLIARKTGLRMLMPLHPRTRRNLERYGMLERIASDPHIRIVEPLGYLEFICLLDNSSLVLTDSGGVQEEACILGVPCITLRKSTERPETLERGNVILRPEILREMRIPARNSWDNPYGKGDAAKKIVGILRGDLSKKERAVG